MSIRSSGGERPPILLGALCGIGAWLLGYALFFLLVGPDVQDSFAQQLIEAVEGEPATHEMVGWVFYNAHFVDTAIVDIPITGDTTVNAIADEEGFSQLLYLVPVALLGIAGLALARLQGAATTRDGILAGVTVVPGYLLLSIVGIFLFEVSFGGATGAPEQATAIVLAGLVYPAVFGAGGGLVGALTAE